MAERRVIDLPERENLGLGGQQATCANPRCDEQFIRTSARGRPKDFHDEECRRAAERHGDRAAHALPLDQRLRLERVWFEWNRKFALSYLFDAFSSREPAPTSLENALSDRRPRGMGYFLSLSSFGMCEPSGADSRPVLA